jgi:voltage-gated potassium channel
MSVIALFLLGLRQILPKGIGFDSIFSSGDLFLCALFMGDFLFRLKCRGLEYLRWGWLDFLSSIPTVGFLRGARLVRVIRVFRLIRILRASHQLNTSLARQWPNLVTLGMFAFAFLLLVVSALAVLHVESDLGNITSGEDALWWSLATMTTVGYGDFYPVTTGGRVIGMFLMVTGIGLLGSVLARLAATMTDYEQEDENREILRKLDEVTSRLDSVLGHLEKEKEDTRLPSNRDL